MKIPLFADHVTENVFQAAIAIAIAAQVPLHRNDHDTASAADGDANVVLSGAGCRCRGMRTTADRRLRPPSGRLPRLEPGGAGSTSGTDLAVVSSSGSESPHSKQKASVASSSGHASEPSAPALGQQGTGCTVT
ncbi:MAG TPA: hypothetical protein VGR26_05670 [Acidimicrobiales bacterium]|nr:hypothetical protein [Acidimicrobiales bacterium]